MVFRFLRSRISVLVSIILDLTFSSGLLWYMWAKYGSYEVLLVTGLMCFFAATSILLIQHVRPKMKRSSKKDTDLFSLRLRRGMLSRMNFKLTVRKLKGRPGQVMSEKQFRALMAFLEQLSKKEDRE